MDLPEALRARLRDLIGDRCGLYFKDHDLESLESAILERTGALGLSSPCAYYEKLTAAEEGEEEFRELLDRLTVQHGYFFRGREQFALLAEHFLGVWAHRAERRPLRIWSAGCSNGEEPYTVAMVLQEALGEAEAAEASILATDVSTNAIEHARKGVYRAPSLKGVPEAIRQKYFKASGGETGGYEVIPSIRERVRFRYLNLVSDDYPDDLDAIFCRNVFIYFRPETVRTIAERFHSSLRGDGALFIGYSESLQFLTDRFRMRQASEAIYYVRSDRTP